MPANDVNVPYHLRADVVEQNQAVGRYITTFSELVASMKSGIHALLAPLDDEHPHGSPLVEALTGPLTADPLRAAFFGMCAVVGEYNDDDRRVSKALQALIQRAIEIRNQVAHADWSLGWTVHETGEALPPSAHKVAIRKDGVHREVVKVDAEFLTRESDRMEYLRRAVSVFYHACRRRQQGHTDRPSAHLLCRKEGDGVEMVIMRN